MARSTVVRWSILGVLVIAAIAVTVWVGTPGASNLDHRFAAEEIRTLTQDSGDPERAAGAVGHIRGHLAEGLGEQFDAFLRRLLVRALIASESPAAEIAEAAADAGPRLPQQGAIRVMFYVEVANALLERGEAATDAKRFAQMALDDIPVEQKSHELDAFVRGALGRAQAATGECEAAIENLSVAVTVLPDSQPVLAGLGAAYEKCGKPELAINHYIRALGVYGSRDASAKAPLEALYAAKHGSLDGLGAKIDAAHQASLQREVFESRRFEKPMPVWSAEDMNGATVRSEDHAGKIMVLDFWGSWCGPCRMELPHFQAMYEKYRDKGVVFYGVNWERVDRSQRRTVAKAYMDQNGFDFPTVLDLDDRVSMSFQVESFPTVYLIDGKGRIRYRNVGFSEGIGEIMELQLDSMLAEAQPAAKPKAQAKKK